MAPCAYPPIKESSNYLPYGLQLRKKVQGSGSSEVEVDSISPHTFTRCLGVPVHGPSAWQMTGLLHKYQTTLVILIWPMSCMGARSDVVSSSLCVLSSTLHFPNFQCVMIFPSNEFSRRKEALLR